MSFPSADIMPINKICRYAAFEKVTFSGKTFSGKKYLSGKNVEYWYYLTNIDLSSYNTTFIFNCL